MKPYEIWESCKLYNLITNKANNFLAFSTKKKAEEYILMNKPCLSINDIKHMLYSGARKNKLAEKIVKSRL